MTVDEITALLASLRKARARGVRTTTHGDTSTTYSSDAEMAAAIADLERLLAIANGTPRRGVNYIYQRDKGL